MFIGRIEELNTLNTLYDTDGFQMAVIYGRRRIGKSTLISEFVKDKKTIYYTATNVTKERNIELFAGQVLDGLDIHLGNIHFDDLESIFSFLTNNINKERIILVIDELPYWAENDTSILSIIQKYIDTYWQHTNLFIILCGSSLSFMENKLLSEKSPLFGRRTTQIKLDAFDYIESSYFVPNYTYEEKATVYGITGGVAKYLSLINPMIPLEDNIKSLFFHKNGYLYDETRNLLIQEFNDIALVNSVVEQIAAGEGALNVISDKVHEKEPKVSYILKKLINVGLVEKRYCITEEKNKKKTQYILKDHMFKFWYRFVAQAQSVIEMNAGSLYYDKVVKPNLHTYMGKVFEEMCKYYTFKQGVAGDFDSFITNVGSWWGNEIVVDENGNKQIQSADIDVVGISSIDHSCIIGECKFKNEKIDRSVYETLIRRSVCLSNKYRIKKYLFFSLSGFTDYFLQVDENVILITLEDMYK